LSAFQNITNASHGAQADLVSFSSKWLGCTHLYYVFHVWDSHGRGKSIWRVWL